MSLNLDTLFTQLKETSSGTHVQLKTSTPTGRTAEPYYPVIHALPPCDGEAALNILKGREPGPSQLTYTPVSGELK